MELVKKQLARARKKTTGFRAETRRKRGVDRSVTARSNWGWAFVFNRSAMGGGAEEIAVIAVIARDRRDRKNGEGDGILKLRWESI